MSDQRWVRVLGPIDVTTPSGERSVGGRRQRALLGALTIGAGRAVPTDQLRRCVWGDRSPRTARNTLQSYVSHLRDLLGAEAIVRVDHSYAIDIDRVRIDAVEFTRLLRRAEVEPDPEDRWRLTHDALGLWRGPAFGDLRDDEAFRLEAFRLEELRLAAMELNLAADLALGRHDLIVPQLETAVREHPYRERLWRLLVEALVLADRRVEALAACGEWRAVLGDVGIEPTGALVELEERIRTAVPGPDIT